jgi:hypothetical protein
MPVSAETNGMAQRRNEAEIKQLVEQYRASGLTQLEYSRQAGVVLSTLTRYLRRHATTQQPLLRVNVEPASEPDAGFALILGNGRRIETTWQFSDAEIARLIRVAESA